MDDFVKCIGELLYDENIVEQTREMSYKNESRYNYVLKKISLSEHDIKMEDSIDGDIRFSISIANLGLTYDDITEYKTEIFSRFFINFIGELLIREKIDHFAGLLTNIDNNKYDNIVNRYIHDGFGLKVNRNRFIFSFHISLVQKILTEDFRREIKRKLEESK